MSDCYAVQKEPRTALVQTDPTSELTEIEALKLELENCDNQSRPQDHIQQDKSFVDCQQSQPSENNSPLHEERADCLSANKDDSESLKKEICDVLKCLNQERCKYHDTKEKLKTKLCRAKQRLAEETNWRDEKIQDLERELSFCSHSLTKEKELIIYVTMENDKLLIEKRRLLQQLTDEVYNKNAVSSCVSKHRVDFLEMENKKLHNKILDLSSQISSLQQFAEELKNERDVRKMTTLLPAQTSRSSLLFPDFVSSSQCSSLARSAEMGYLNLNTHSPSLLNTTDA